jgi:urea transport system substrate-binding protein
MGYSNLTRRCLMATAGLALGLAAVLPANAQDTIKVGVLHSLSGTMTASERPLQELLIMLIGQQNAKGGLLGRPLEPVIMNPRSDTKAYGTQAHALIAEHKVAAIFGCWTSASRKEVLPIVERENALLFYPSQYEGQEASPNIYYLGATPQQQGVPAINFLRAEGYRRFILVGTDYIYPRTTNAVLKGYLASQGILGSDVVERYTPFGCKDWSAVVESIRRFARGGGAAIISTVSGDANLHFYRELERQGVSAKKIPVMSLSITETELPALMRFDVAGHFVAWNYLHAFDRRENRAFIADWRRFTGQPEAVTNDPMEATWIGFNLWCAAVAAAGSTEIDQVRAALSGRQIAAPSGFTAKMDGRSHHLYKPVMIGASRAREASSRSGSLKGWFHRNLGAGGLRRRRRSKRSLRPPKGLLGRYPVFRPLRGWRPRPIIVSTNALEAF